MAAIARWARRPCNEHPLQFMFDPSGTFFSVKKDMYDSLVCEIWVRRILTFKENKRVGHQYMPIKLLYHRRFRVKHLLTDRNSTTADVPIKSRTASRFESLINIQHVRSVEMHISF